MKTKLPSRFASRFLFYGLGFMTLLGNAKSVLAGDTTGVWAKNATPPAGLAMSLEEVAYNSVKTYILSPLVVVGILFYASYFYMKIRKRDAKKTHRMFVWGTRSFLAAAIIYAVIVVFISYILAG